MGWIMLENRWKVVGKSLEGRGVSLNNTNNFPTTFQQLSNPYNGIFPCLRFGMTTTLFRSML